MRKLVLIVITALITTSMWSAGVVAEEITLRCSNVDVGGSRDGQRLIAGDHGWVLDREKKKLWKFF